jgi:putative copper export protein
VILTLMVQPTAQRVVAESKTLDALLNRLRQRFTPLANFSLAVLIVTGLVQMTGDANYEGVLQFDNEWSRVILLKHIAIGGMVTCGLLLQYGVAPALERASLLAERGKDDPAATAALRRREARLTWAALALGIVVLGFSAWATAI